MAHGREGCVLRARVACRTIRAACQSGLRGVERYGTLEGAAGPGSVPVGDTELAGTII